MLPVCGWISWNLSPVDTHIVNYRPTLITRFKKGKGSPYSIIERRVPELIPVLSSDVSHKPGGRLPLLSTRPAVTPTTLKRSAIPVLLLGEQRHDGCEQFATRQRRDCNLNSRPSAPESSMLTTRPTSHPLLQGQSVFITVPRIST